MTFTGVIPTPSGRCDRVIDGAPCERVVVYQVGFSFKPIDGRPRLPAMTSIGVCAECKENLEVDDFLSDDMRAAAGAVMRAMGGIVDPSSYRLTFTAIH